MLRGLSVGSGRAVLVALLACTVGWLSVAGASAQASTPDAAAVALGDSFASGYGLKPRDPGTELVGGNGCERSSRAWPRLLGVSPDHDFACAGATIMSLSTPQRYGPLAGSDGSSQLDQLAKLAGEMPISRVYLTIGLNDLGFDPILERCVIGRCLGGIDSVVIPNLVNGVGPQIEASLRQIASLAPAAQVLLVGYPQLVPEGEVNPAKCGWLTPGERLRVRRLWRRLDLTLASRAAAAGTAYVSLSDALAGHELCSTHPWFLRLARRNRRAVGGWQFIGEYGAHPTNFGHAAMAVRVRHGTS